jgi:hypothetical protein
MSQAACARRACAGRNSGTGRLNPKHKLDTVGHGSGNGSVAGDR